MKGSQRGFMKGRAGEYADSQVGTRTKSPPELRLLLNLRLSQGET
jgi:hypothetical protein